MQQQLIGDAFSGKFMIDLINTNLEESDVNAKLSTDEISLYPKKEMVIEVKPKKVSLF
jgi:hypothetical protein